MGKFIKGHQGYWKDKKFTEEHRQKIREAGIGRIVSEETKIKLRKKRKGYKGHIISQETRKKMRKSLIGTHHKGHTAWNKGLTKETDERVRKYGENERGRVAPNKDKHPTEETRAKMRKSQLGHLAWNKGLTKETDERMKRISEKLKDIKFTEVQRRNMMHRRIPSSLEKKFQEILDKYKLPYKYVGNGKFFIESYNPDFVNTNNEKIAIEVYARYYKLRNNETIEGWKKRRIKKFAEYGWSIIFFDETEANEKNILEVLT